MRGLLYILLFLFVTLSVAKADRCVNYVNDVRKAHYKVFGLDYPYWYGGGQLKQESGCRDIVSKDGIGSQGLPQITYRWWSKFLTSKGVYDIKSISNQTLAQAYIMQDAKNQAYSSHLWVSYQIYNGGGLVNKEITKARKVGKYDLNNNLIQVFNTVREAKKDTCGAPNVLKGNRKTAGGYIWKYIED